MIDIIRKKPFKKSIFYVLLSSLFLLFCSSGLYHPEQEPVLLVYPQDPLPGEPVSIAVSLPLVDEAAGDTVKALLVSDSGKQTASIPLIKLENDINGNPVLAGTLAVPNTCEEGPARILIHGLNGTELEQTVLVQHRDFVSEDIVLNEANTAIRSEPDPQKTIESRELWEIITSVHPFFFDGSAFIAPTTATRRTSFFGDRRVYLYSNGRSDTSIHAGIDYGIPTGTPILACASGRVVMSKSRIVTGNTVIIEHLPGVYSLYYHLDTLSLSVNQLIDKGTIIGTSGSTGLSTGPHLHWEIRVHGEMADPDSFVNRAVLDKDEILSKMNELVRKNDE